MFTTTTLLTSLRPGLTWLRARLATRSTATASLRELVIGSCRLPLPVPIPVPRRTGRLIAATAALASLALAGFSGSAMADTRSGFETVADGRLVDVQVQIDGRGTTPLYFAPGRFDRRYFQAFEGRNYSLVLRNNTGRRIGVLIAVDGLNVINGDRSSMSRHEPMYVLDPHERAVIRGWRTSLDQVRRFVFVDEERSYAERTGQANGDMGWIRVLAFREQRPFWDNGGKIRERDELPYGAMPELERKDAPREQGEMQKSAPSAPEAQMYGQRQENDNSNPGTGWGQQQWDRVNRTQFLAEASPVDRITLRYEYASGLRALGIRIRSGRERLWERENGDLGFAQPPRW